MKWNKSNLNCLRVEYAHTEQLDLSILCVALHSIRNIEGVSVSFDREKWNDKLINRKEKKKKQLKIDHYLLGGRGNQSGIMSVWQQWQQLGDILIIDLKVCGKVIDRFLCIEIGHCYARPMMFVLSDSPSAE